MQMKVKYFEYDPNLNDCNDMGDLIVYFWNASIGIAGKEIFTEIKMAVLFKLERAFTLKEILPHLGDKEKHFKEFEDFTIVINKDYVNRWLHVELRNGNGPTIYEIMYKDFVDN